MAHQNNQSSGTNPSVSKSVTLVSAYEPIIVYDQYENPYICLNSYEAEKIRWLISELRIHGSSKYDTGDWWLDLPARIRKWQEQVNDLELKDD